MHRFVWDVRYARPPVVNFSYPIAAVPYNTPKLPAGVWVLPGTYTARLTVDGKSQSQAFTVRMDPRVKTPPAGLKAQFDTARVIESALKASYEAMVEARAAQGEAAQKAAQDLQRINATFSQLLGIVENADAAPTTQAIAAVEETRAALAAAMGWKK